MTSVLTVLATTLSTAAPAPLATHWYVHSVTTYSDGSADVQPAVELTEQNAESIAKRIGHSLASEIAKLRRERDELRQTITKLENRIAILQPVAPSQVQPVSVPLTDTREKGGRCWATTTSGERCRRVALDESLWCTTHRANRPGEIKP